MILSLCMSVVMILKGQPWFSRTDSVRVSLDSTGNIGFPWVGGLNSCQFSQIDLNNDGIKDLFVFDRSGNKISTFINRGTANKVDYVFAPQYRNKFPKMTNWVLLVDYNCDGKEDIFTWTGPGIKVYRNDSDPGGLKFTLVTPNYLHSNYHPSITNLYVSSVDIPSITDIDGDGDVDIITMSLLGTAFEYHQNMSEELYGSCDSLSYQLQTSCWGNFAESFSSNQVTLNMSCKTKAYTPDSIDVTKIMHSGSCELCLDADGDGDKEILIGGIGFSNMTFVKNGGSASSAKMVSQDPNYPPSLPVNMTIFPCGFYLDVDNDSLNDLIVSPNEYNASEDFTSVSLYKNTGRKDSVSFTYKKSNFLQDEMIDVGEGAYPAFFDYNGDGLKDLLIGDYKYFTASGLVSKIALFKNTGTANNPSYSLVTRDYQSLSSLNLVSMTPAFADMDNDGDLDMIIGNDAGQLYYFTNNPSGGLANFTYMPPVLKDSSGTVIDVGNYATPQIIDVDRDGKLDLLIGNSGGKISYYRNIGTANIPSFKKVSAAFGGVSVVRKSTGSSTGYSVPFMFDDAGTYKLLIGSESGYVYYYNNIDGNLSGNFTLVDSAYQQIWEGTRISIAGSDINNDGFIDIVVGNYAGGVALYMGQSTNSIAEFRKEKIEFSLFPNPANDQINFKIDNENATYKIEIIDMLGRNGYEQKSNQPLLTISTASLQNGVYICRVIAENKQTEVYAVKKFVVNH